MWINCGQKLITNKQLVEKETLCKVISCIVCQY